MNYYYIEPEVAGGLGDGTVLSLETHPPVVTRLHYQFDGWLGDILLESFPSFIITEDGMQALNSVAATGIIFEEVEVSTSEEFDQLFPGIYLPRFVWLQIRGTAGLDDFGIASDGRLVISDRALGALRELGINNAVTEEFNGP